LSYCPRSSLSVEVLAWLAGRLAHLPPRPPGQGGNPPLSLEVRLDAVGAVILDGLSYRRAGRIVGISKTEVGDSLDLLLGALAKLGVCQPDGCFVTSLADLAHLTEMTRSGTAVLVDGLATCCSATVAGPQLPRARAAGAVGDRRGAGHQRGHHPGRPRVSRAGQGSGALACADRRPAHHRPAHRRRTRLQPLPGGLRALVEQSIGHLAGAWSLRRWRGLLVRVRDVYRAAAALVSLGRWRHRIPT
jgi:hypothetical protein